MEQHKIKIVWIDDRERISGYPQLSVPVKFRDHFEISHPMSTNQEAMSYESVAEFVNVLNDFWWKNDTRFLPAEIYATDYNLQKSSAGVAKKERKHPDPTSSDEIQDGKERVREEGDSHERPNFEGYLTGMFSAILTYAHPSTLVSITNYMGKMPLECDSLRMLGTPFLGEHYETNLVATERSWENILTQGVPSLRDRIMDLFIGGEIDLSLSDLMEIYEHCTGYLTVRSKYCTRKLPIGGLFADYIDDSEQKKNEEIRAWIKDLIHEYSDMNISDLSESMRIAEKLWEAYNNDTLFQDRWKLSELAFKDKNGDHLEENTELYNELCKKFGIVDDNQSWKKCMSNVIDISVWDVDDLTKRWAAIIVLAKLLQRTYFAQKNWAKCNEYDNYTVPTVSASDWFMALYPSSSGSVILPPHKAATPDWTSDNRGMILKRFKIKNSDHLAAEDIELAKKDGNFGNIALIPNDVFDGVSWGKTIKTNNRSRVSGGLTKKERGVLRLLLIDWNNSKDDDLMNCGVIRKVLQGEDSHE